MVTYICLMRGVNVGGNNALDMKTKYCKSTTIRNANTARKLLALSMKE